MVAHICSMDDRMPYGWNRADTADAVDGLAKTFERVFFSTEGGADTRGLGPFGWSGMASLKDVHGGRWMAIRTSSVSESTLVVLLGDDGPSGTRRSSYGVRFYFDAEGNLEIVLRKSAVTSHDNRDTQVVTVEAAVSPQQVKTVLQRMVPNSEQGDPAAADLPYVDGVAELCGWSASVKVFQPKPENFATIFWSPGKPPPSLPEL